MPERRRGRRILTALLVAGALAIVAWLALPIVLEPLLRRKLEESLARHIDGDLRIGTLSYSFPLGLRADNVKLVSRDQSIELFRADRVEFALDKIPIGSGPLLIERIALERPAVHWAPRRAAATAPSGSAPAATTAPQRPPLSELLRLRELRIHDGSIRYDRAGGGAPRPLSFEHINTELRLTAQSPALYAWEFTADNGPAADVAASGKLDIDQLVLEIGQLAVNGHADGSSLHSLPPPLRDVLGRYGITGTARLDATGRLPLREVDQMRIAATLDLSDLRAHIVGTPLRCNTRIAADQQPGQSVLRLDLLRATGLIGDGSIEVSAARAEFDRRTLHWRLLELQANAADLTFKPRGFDEPVREVGGQVRLDGDELVFESVTAACGEDRCAVSAARVPLAPWREDRIDVRFGPTDLDLRPTSASPYPAVPARIIGQLAPAGRFIARGRYLVDLKGRDDYELIVVTQDAALALHDRRVPITNIRGEVLITPRSVSLRRLLGNVFGGAIASTGEIHLSAEPMDYRGEISIQQLDLRQLAKAYPERLGESKRLEGRADGNLSIRGTGKTLAGFGATGELGIVDGHFWEMPVLSQVVAHIKVARDALRAGQAAAVLELSGGAIKLHRAAITSPAMGLQGSGTVDWQNDRLELDVIAVPIGDWAGAVRRTGVPVVSDLAASIAGGAQRVFGAATSTLLYQFKVSGPLSSPRVEPVPVPIVTDTAAQFLQKIVRGDKDLLEEVREKK